MSVVDRPLRITSFDSVRAKEGTPAQLSLRGLTELVKTTAARDKGALPLVKIGRFAANRRSNAALETVSGIELDYDAGKMPMAEAVAALSAAGLAALVYETPSNTPVSHRWRAILPCGKEQPAAERDRLVARANGVLKGAIAPESFTPGQIYYIGGVSGRKRRTELIEGDAIDTRPDLDAAAVRKGQRSDGAKGPDESRSGRHYRAALRSISNGLSYHEHLRTLDDDLHAYAMEVRGASTKGEHDWKQASARHKEEKVRKLDSFRSFETAHPDGTRFLTAQELCERPRPNDFLEGLLYDNLLSIWYGAPKSGKSFLLLDLASHIANGEPWANLAVERRNVLIIPLEGEGLLRDRIRAWEIHNVRSCPVIFSPFPLHLISDEQRISEIISYCQEHRIGLIIIDTLARAMRGGNENDFSDMSRALAGADKIRMATGAHVMLVHHTTKDGKSARGHSDLIGNPDLLVEISKPASSDEYRKATVTANRHGPEGMSLQFAIKSVETDIRNKRGSQVRSGVACVATEGFTDLDKADERGGAEAGLEVLRRLSRISEVIDRDAGVERADWRSAVDKSGLWQDAKNDSTRRSHFKRMVDRLVKARLIRREGSKFYPTAV